MTKKARYKMLEASFKKSLEADWRETPPVDKFVERCYNKKLEQKYNDLAVDLIQEALGSKHKGK